MLFNPGHIVIDPTLQKLQAGRANVAGRIIQALFVVNEGLGLEANNESIQSAGKRPFARGWSGAPLNLLQCNKITCKRSK